MNIMRIAHFKDAWEDLPPDKKGKIATESMAFTEKYRKLGKVKDYYGLMDGQGTVTILNFASDDEAYRFSVESPLQPYVDVEIIPLVDAQVMAKIVEDQIKVGRGDTRKGSKK